MEIREGLRYTKSHEWARLQGDEVVVGVSDYAVEALNRDIVFVELPNIGQAVRQGDPFGVIEAVKAVYDLYSPVTGTVVAINDAAAMNAAIVGQSPFDDGWLIRVKVDRAAELDNLLPPGEYGKHVEAEKEKH
jgi:glycine cleavage system H protein